MVTNEPITVILVFLTFPPFAEVTIPTVGSNWKFVGAEICMDCKSPVAKSALVVSVSFITPKSIY